MELYLSEQCESLTGSLNSNYGYYIRSTKTGRFFSQRSKHGAPPDGHWRFIRDCAQLAQARLHLVDIFVTRDELKQALLEARLFIPATHLRRPCSNARQIINFKITFSL